MLKEILDSDTRGVAWWALFIYVILCNLALYAMLIGVCAELEKNCCFFLLMSLFIIYIPINGYLFIIMW